MCDNFNRRLSDVELFLRDGKIFNPKIDFFSDFLVAAENEIYLHKLQAKRFVFPASSSRVVRSKAVNGASNYTNFLEMKVPLPTKDPRRQGEMPL